MIKDEDLALQQQMTAQIEASLRKLQPKVPSRVRLVAVTKTFPVEVVRAAYRAGIRDFAENKVQEALEKQAQFSDFPDVTWHFIGRLQSNKTRKVLEHFDWIHSVDSLNLAMRLNQQAAELKKQPTCFLQVKLAPDPTKTGFEPDALWAALPALNGFTHLSWAGLMVIAPYGLSALQTQQLFAQAKDLSDRLSAQAQADGLNQLNFAELSMGMSGDFEQAIAAGSTVIRLGSILFGQRG
jgi:PLP dependent protein